MKSFFQEYGGTIIASLVVVCLIAVCTVIKPLATESHVSIVDKLSNYVEETLDNASKNDLNSVLSENNKTLTIAIDDGLRYFDESEDSLPSSFSITYTDGMTWGEWVNSEYNNVQFTVYCHGEGFIENQSATVKLKYELVENGNAIKLKVTTFTGPAFDVVYKEGFCGAYLEIFDTYENVNLTDEIDSTKDYIVDCY